MWLAETEHEPVVAYVARCKVENDQMCCLYFVYFCVFLYLVPGSVSLLVFYMFLCFPGFFVLSSWVYLSPRPWYRVALGCSSLLFSILSCVLCVFVFFSYFYFNVTARVLCVFVFLCICLLLLYSRCWFYRLCVFCVLVFFSFLSKVFFFKICPLKGGGGGYN